MATAKFIPDPERLLHLFIQYQEWAKATPFKKMVFVGKDGTQKFEERERPLSISSFEVYLMNNKVIGDLSHYFANTKGAYGEFVDVCRFIRTAIKSDQIDGGMAGVYNAGITARLNGLSETQTIQIEQKEIFKGLDINVPTNNGSIEDSKVNKED